MAQFQNFRSSQPAGIFSADQQPISGPAQPAAKVFPAPPHRHHGEILDVQQTRLDVVGVHYNHCTNSSLRLSFSHSFIIKLEIHNLSNIHAKYLKLFYTFLYQTSFFISPSFFLKYKKYKPSFWFFLMWSRLARYSMFYTRDTFCSGYFYCFH